MVDLFYTLALHSVFVEESNNQNFDDEKIAYNKSHCNTPSKQYGNDSVIVSTRSSSSSTLGSFINISLIVYT